MEKALEFCKNRTITYIVFSEVSFRNGVVSAHPAYVDNSSFYMPAEKFVEMIFDMVNDGIIIDVHSICIGTFNYAPICITICHDFMGKYAVAKIWKRPGSFSYVISLSAIIGDNLYTYLHDEYNRHKIRNEITQIKALINTFIDDQKSYDDVTRFKRIIESL